MGAITKETYIYGKNLQRAFRQLQDEDQEQCGSDIYSGGWNNATGVREVSQRQYEELLKEHRPSKHEDAIAWCKRKPVVNKMKVKTSVTNFPQKGTRKWITQYVAENEKGFEVVCELSQTVAIKKARAYVEKNPHDELCIYITKRLTGTAKVAEVNYKKSKSEADGMWEVTGCMSY